MNQAEILQHIKAGNFDALPWSRDEAQESWGSFTRRSDLFEKPVGRFAACKKQPEFIMRAKDIDLDQAARLYPNYLYQPKLNGVRAVYYPERHRLVTRNGNEILSCDHILEELRSCRVSHPLDGELYIHKGIMTDATRNIPKHYGIKPKQIRERTKSSFSILAEGGSHKLTAMVRGNRVSLSHFGVRPSRPGVRRPKKGVSVQVGTTRKRIAHSFIATMPTGHRGVFQRKSLVRGKVGGSIFGRRGDPNLEKIHELKGPATPQMMANKDVAEAISDGAANRFTKNLDHEIDRMLKGFGVRGGSSG